jgi:hypothetical protein
MKRNDQDAPDPELTAKPDPFDEATGEETAVAKKAHTGISELASRVASLELRTKLWGGGMALLTGVVATVIVNLLTRQLLR